MIADRDSSVALLESKALPLRSYFPSPSFWNCRYDGESESEMKFKRNSSALSSAKLKPWGT